MTLGERAVMCNRCEFSQGNACTVDAKSVPEHVKSNACPNGYYDNPPDMMSAGAAFSVESLAASIPLAGDVLEKIICRVGADRLATWWTKMTGHDCGCADRQAWLNRTTEKLVRWAHRDGKASEAGKG
jgi:hypothetical protein